MEEDRELEQEKVISGASAEEQTDIVEEDVSEVLAAPTIIVDKEDIDQNIEEGKNENADERTDESVDEDQTEDTEDETDNSDDAGNEERAAGAELSEEDREIAERIRQRKKETEKKRSRLKRRVITAAVLLVAGIVAIALSFTSIFTVDSIEVRGNSHYSAEEIISIGHAAPGKNLIYHSDKGSITKYLTSNPYIKTAEVSRKLPSTLVITVSERTPLMALVYDDDYLILDGEGILLQKSRTKPKLTVVEGNIISRIKLGQELGTQDADLMKKTSELMQAMADNDLYFVKLDMTDKYTIKAYVYDSLIVKNDYQTLLENISNGKLHLVLDKLFSESIKRGTITFNEDGTSTFMPGF